jgi:hypothetical protein
VGPVSTVGLRIGPEKPGLDSDHILSPLTINWFAGVSIMWPAAPNMLQCVCGRKATILSFSHQFHSPSYHTSSTSSTVVSRRWAGALNIFSNRSQAWSAVAFFPVSSCQTEWKTIQDSILQKGDNDTYIILSSTDDQPKFDLPTRQNGRQFKTAFYTPRYITKNNSVVNRWPTKIWLNKTRLWATLHALLVLHSFNIKAAYCFY